MSAADLAIVDLLRSDRLTEATRRVLAERVAWRGAAPTLLTERQLALLDAVAKRLVPLGGLNESAQLAARWEAELAGGKGDGWRYANMPADAEALRSGLDALDAAGFLTMGDAEKDALLRKLQAAEVADWPVAADRWFEEVLTNLAQLAYGHPAVQLSIGYDGMADAHGFQDLDG